MATDASAGGSGVKHVIALFQGAAKNGDNAAHNLGRMKEEMRKASVVGAKMIIFPELFLSGYQASHEDLKRLAEERGGASFQELSAVAKETGIAVVYGYPEVDRSGGEIRYYNSAQLVDRDGKSLLNHRKVHLWLADEGRHEAIFTPGDEFNIAECCGLKIGLLICYDVEFPEAVRALALKGAQFIAVPTAITPEFQFTTVVDHIVPTRAMENRVYVAYTNLADSVFCGHSVCSNPSGEVVVKGGWEEGLLLATIDANFKAQWSYLSDRRPTMYKDLVA